ncbi:MAG: dockerin type I repeat-containing protein [Planctomycetota bacterium]
MRRLFGLGLVGVSLCILFCPRLQAQVIVDDELIMRRGDSNADGVVNLTDATYINAYLFLGGPEPPCMNQADANDDGVLDVTDSAYLLNWLFMGGPAPPWPGPYNTVCVADTSNPLGCRSLDCD